MAKYLVKGKVMLLCKVTVEAEGSIMADGEIEYDEAEVIEE